jgi:dGTPase
LRNCAGKPVWPRREESIAEWFRAHSADPEFWKGIEGRGKNDPLSTDQLQNDFLKFEGNAQTVRLVTRLQLLNELGVTGVAYYVNPLQWID